MRLGFIGGWGHHYLRGLVSDASRPCNLAVASDTHDAEAAKRLAASLGQVQWSDDPQHMLDRFRPDYVSVGAVYGYNADMIALALERAIPTVSDKPIAASWSQLDRIKSLLDGTDRVLLTEFDFRSRATFRAARQAVAAGHIGDVVLATAQKSYKWGSRPAWYADRQAYGGTMLWIASHGIDAIRFTTGKRFLRVSARHGNLSHPDYGSAEDHTAAMFELEGGATGLVHADFLRPAAAPTHGDDRLRIAGSKGVIEIRDNRCVLLTHDQPPADITDSASPQPIHTELLAALRRESTDLYSTAWSLELAAVMLAARDAADTGQPVAIAADFV